MTDFTDILNLNAWYRPPPRTTESFSLPKTEPTPNQAISQGANANLAAYGGTPASANGPTISEMKSKLAQDPNVTMTKLPATLDTSNPSYQLTNSDVKANEDEAWSAYASYASVQEMKNLKMGMGDSFCECTDNNPGFLDQQCGTLTEYNCKNVGCCVFTSTGKCKAGNAQGMSMSMAPIDYYYYMNKCYGEKCPKNDC